MTQPCSWHTSGGEERRVKVMALFLFGWWKTKVIETLTPKGYLLITTQKVLFDSL